jgi:uncharacterized integral membrane protein
MRRLLKVIVIAPFALIFIAFAYANRHSVTIEFDPFAAGDIPAFSLTAPLFVVLILTAIFGVLAGGVVTWLAQGRYRRAARQSRAQAEQFRAEAAALRGNDTARGIVPTVSAQRRA